MISKRSRGLLPTPRFEGFDAGSHQGKPDSLHSLLKTPSVMDAASERMAKTEQEFGNSGTLAQEMATGFLSQRVSPASPSAMPDEGRERMMTATSGQRLWQSSPQPGPSGCCLRTCLESSRWYSPIVALEWVAKPLYSRVRMRESTTTTPSSEELTETSDKQGIHQFTWLYQLAASERRTDETGCGLLPTATADDANNVTRKSGQYQSLTRNIAMLPTPQTMDSIDMVRPVEWRGNSPRIKSNQGIDGQAGVQDVVGSLTGAKTGTQLRLEPAFVEYLMGLPENWTAIE